MFPTLCIRCIGCEHDWNQHHPEAQSMTFPVLYEFLIVRQVSGLIFTENRKPVTPSPLPASRPPDYRASPAHGAMALGRGDTVHEIKCWVHEDGPTL